LRYDVASEGAMFQREEYVKVITTGAIGRVEQWTQATDQYSVEFDRDSSTRKWFNAGELERAQPGEVRQVLGREIPE
jgi:hypothetical protein